MGKILTTIKPINWQDDRIFALKQYIDVVAKTKCNDINFNFSYLKYNNKNELLNIVKIINDYLKNKNINVPVTHAPYIDNFYFTNDLDYQNTLEEKITDAIEVSKLLNAKIIVYHAGIAFKNGVYDEEATINENVKFALKIAKNAQKLGIKVAVENNVCENKTINGEIVEPSPTLLAKVCKQVEDEIGSGVFGICYDIGHINLTKYDLYENLQKCKDYLFTLHIHNNNGLQFKDINVWKNDLHNSITNGNIDIVAFLKELKTVFSGDIVIESKYKIDDNLQSSIEDDYLLANEIINN